MIKHENELIVLSGITRSEDIARAKNWMRTFSFFFRQRETWSVEQFIPERTASIASHPFTSLIIIAILGFGRHQMTRKRVVAVIIVFSRKVLHVDGRPAPDVFNVECSDAQRPLEVVCATTCVRVTRRPEIGFRRSRGKYLPFGPFTRNLGLVGMRLFRLRIKMLHAFWYCLQLTISSAQLPFVANTSSLSRFVHGQCSPILCDKVESSGLEGQHNAFGAGGQKDHFNCFFFNYFERRKVTPAILHSFGDRTSTSARCNWQIKNSSSSRRRRRENQLNLTFASFGSSSVSVVVAAVCRRPVTANPSPGAMNSGSFSWTFSHLRCC